MDYRPHQDSSFRNYRDTTNRLDDSRPINPIVGIIIIALIAMVIIYNIVTNGVASCMSASGSSIDCVNLLIAFFMVSAFSAGSYYLIKYSYLSR